MNNCQSITPYTNDFQTEVHDCCFGMFQPIDYQYAFELQNPSTFTGKELDSETGYSYFGARYYDAELSGLFFSVDPMADKYPNMSPYAYCAWNSVKLVDPDGNRIKAADIYSEKQIIRYLNDIIGLTGIFTFRNGFLVIRSKKFDKLYKDASDDLKMLLDGIRDAIEVSQTAFILVQSNNNMFHFELQYESNGDIYDDYKVINVGDGSGATGTSPFVLYDDYYPIAINDKGDNQRNNLTTDYYNADGTPQTTTTTASCVFIHELLDEFLSTIVNKETSSNRGKVCYENAALRQKGLIERNGEDHDY